MSCAVANAARVSPSRKSAGERLARRERDRVQQAVEAAPLRLRSASNSASICASAVTSQRQHRRRAELGRELDDPIAQVVVDIGERELRAFALARARDAVGDRAVRQQPGDQDLAVGEQAHRRACASEQRRGLHEHAAGDDVVRRRSASAARPRCPRRPAPPRLSMPPSPIRTPRSRATSSPRPSLFAFITGMSCVGGRRDPGAAHGGPAENPFGELQLRFSWKTTRYVPERHAAELDLHDQELAGLAHAHHAVRRRADAAQARLRRRAPRATGAARLRSRLNQRRGSHDGDVLHAVASTRGDDERSRESTSATWAAWIRASLANRIIGDANRAGQPVRNHAPIIARSARALRRDSPGGSRCKSL